MSATTRQLGLAEYLEKEAQSGLTYEGVYGTADISKIPMDYNHDHIRVQIGKGERDFERARQSIKTWRMFPDGWTEIAPNCPEIRAGEVLAMFARFGGIWWRNSCRIIYIVNEKRRYGFAYGTLPDHIARGEELFLVEIDSENKVWYELRAFSRPRYWLAVIGYPILRLLQSSFRKQSAQQMKASIQSIYHS